MKKSFSILTLCARHTTDAVMLAVLAAAVFSGCSRKSADASANKSGPPVLVLVAKAEEKDVPVQISAIGNVMPNSKVTIRSQVTGQLQAVHFKDGQEVKKGDLLFTIDPRPTQAALEQTRADLFRAQAQFENAKVEFDRTKRLFDSKIASQEDFDNARSAMNSAQATVLSEQAAFTNASLTLAFTSINSPLDGVVGGQLVYVGNIIKSPDDAMLVINQIHPIYVLFAVPEQYVTEIRREMRVKPLKVIATFNGLEGEPPQGELTFVDNAVDMTTGTIQLKATFPNADSALWPGQFVQIKLNLKELPSAVVVPSQAIQSGQNGEYAFVVKADESVEMRPVKVGENYEGGTVVLSGLKTGETVVTDGQLNLVAGKKVSVKSPASPGATNNVVPAQQ